jgi:ABC-type glycerol-3-phosphate transport system substrate-binding protein
MWLNRTGVVVVTGKMGGNAMRKVSTGGFARFARASALAALSVLSLGLAGLSTTASAEPVTLKWFMWSGSDAEKAAWQHVADMVTAKYPDIKVQLDTAAWPDYWTKLPTLAASNTLPDIVSLQSLRAPGFATLMVPLDERIKRDKFDIDAFDKSIVGGLSHDGKVFALPYDFGPLLVYYNADLFAKAGVAVPKAGWTVADFIKAAKALTTGNQFGTSLGGVDQVVAWAASAGASYMKGNDLDLTNPKFAAAFQSYVDLVAKEKVAPVLAASGNMQLGDVSRGRFAAGDVAMIIDGPWQLINLKSSVKFTIGLAPLPVGPAGSITVSAGSGFGIATTSTHPEEAWKAVQILTGADAEQFLAAQGRAFASRIAFQKYWYDVAAKGVDNGPEGLDAAQKGALPYVTTPNWNTVNNLFEQYQPLAMNGSQTAAQVLDTITKQLTAQ